MRSIALNMNYTKNINSANNRDRSKLNLVSTQATIAPITKDFYDTLDHATIAPATIAEYPLSNLLYNPSITAEARTTCVSGGGGGYRVGGISITLPTTSVLFSDQGTFNTIYVNINKLNKTYINKFRFTSKTNEAANYLYQYVVVFKEKATPTNYKMLIFHGEYNSLTVKNQSGTVLKEIYNLELSNIAEGNILIDQSLLYHIFGVNSMSSNDYIIEIGIVGVNPLEYTDFSISNVFIGNAIDFYLNEGYSFKRDNLSKFQGSSRIGKTFLEKNESMKSIKNSFEVMEAHEAVENTANFFVENKDYPIAFFPYTNFIADVDLSVIFPPYPTTVLPQHAKLNMQEGGMYYISNDLENKNSFYDTFSIDLELKEYK